jgi:hypothetical protein
MISFRLAITKIKNSSKSVLQRHLSISEAVRVAVDMFLQRSSDIPREALAHRVADIEGKLRFSSVEVRRLNQVHQNNNSLDDLSSLHQVL